jgi:hypothetical protein
MYAPYEEAARSRSPIMKILIRKWDYRYPRVFVAMHFAAAAVLIPFGVIMCAYGWAPIGLVLLAGAAVHVLVAHRVAATTFLVDPGPAAGTR